VWFKHRAWIPIAWLLSLANLVAVWFAARPGEPLHASVHALLAVLFALGAQYLALRKTVAANAEVLARQDMKARLATPEPPQVAQTLDAIAIEVERIGEGQRYLTKLLTEREARSPEAIRSPTEPTD
jgi:hypothetical protein